MSQDVDGKVIVRGNAKILQEFAQYFEGEYADQELKNLYASTGSFERYTLANLPITSNKIQFTLFRLLLGVMGFI